LHELREVFLDRSGTAGPSTLSLSGTAIPCPKLYHTFLLHRNKLSKIQAEE